MACFLIPAAEAVITTVAAKIIKAKEEKDNGNLSLTDIKTDDTPKLTFSRKLGWLNKLLWGGSALLAFEHIWHGEVVPYFPFLTAVQEGETAAMLAEMGSAGVLMAVLITTVWLGMLGVSYIIEKRPDNASDTAEETQ